MTHTERTGLLAIIETILRRAAECDSFAHHKSKEVSPEILSAEKTAGDSLLRASVANGDVNAVLSLFGSDFDVLFWQRRDVIFEAKDSAKFLDQIADRIADVIGGGQ